jgi:hypothetical protein
MIYTLGHATQEAVRLRLPGLLLSLLCGLFGLLLSLLGRLLGLLLRVLGLLLSLLLCFLLLFVVLATGSGGGGWRR